MLKPARSHDPVADVAGDAAVEGVEAVRHDATGYRGWRWGAPHAHTLLESINVVLAQEEVGTRNEHVADAQRNPSVWKWAG